MAKVRDTYNWVYQYPNIYRHEIEEFERRTGNSFYSGESGDKNLCMPMTSGLCEILSSGFTFSTPSAFEVGFGWGNNLLEVSSFIGGGAFYGCEISDLQIKRGRERFGSLLDGFNLYNEDFLTRDGIGGGLMFSVNTLSCMSQAHAEAALTLMVMAAADYVVCIEPNLPIPSLDSFLAGLGEAAEYYTEYDFGPVKPFRIVKTP